MKKGLAPTSADWLTGTLTAELQPRSYGDCLTMIACLVGPARVSSSFHSCIALEQKSLPAAPEVCKPTSKRWSVFQLPFIL